jgi:hypothetical protein
MKDSVAVFFKVVRGWKFLREDGNTSVAGLLVKDVRICGQKSFVVASWMMLGPVIPQILGSRFPVKTILVLCFMAMQPMESHVHDLQSLGHKIVGE